MTRVQADACGCGVSGSQPVTHDKLPVSLISGRVLVCGIVLAAMLESTVIHSCLSVCETPSHPYSLAQHKFLACQRPNHPVHWPVSCKTPQAGISCRARKSGSLRNLSWNLLNHMSRMFMGTTKLLSARAPPNDSMNLNRLYATRFA